MDQKLSFLLEQSIPFNEEKVKLLDELTMAIQNNTPNVTGLLFRQKRRMRFGECFDKMTISGTTHHKSFKFLKFTKQKFLLWWFFSKPSR